MRYRLMAMYEGSPYEAGIGPNADDVVLFAACPPPEELGFEPAAGYWRKKLRFSDVQAVWESRPVGVFRGERCLVFDDLGDQVHIGHLGHDGVTAARLGYVEVDRGVFELLAPRSEVTDIVEERVEVAAPAPADPAPAPVPDDQAGEALPLPTAEPLPAEAEPEAEPMPSAPATSGLRAVPSAEPALANGKSSGPHRPAAGRPDTEPLFAEMASLAGIPPESYSVGKEVEGALCLIESEKGFEVFHASDGARTELQVFETEEAACFYLFGVLAAEALGTGTLARVPGVRSQSA